MLEAKWVFNYDETAIAMSTLNLYVGSTDEFPMAAF